MAVLLTTGVAETEGRYTLSIGKINGKTPKVAQSHAYGMKTMSWTTLAEAEAQKAQLVHIYPNYTFFICVNPCGMKD